MSVPPRPLRILIADDEPDAVHSLAALLRAEGFAVSGVHRAADVRGAICDFAPDVVLLDIGMPQMTGYDVARELRSRYGSARPVLIAVTGHAQTSDKALARLAGFDHHVAKPYDPGALVALVASAAARGAPR